MEINDLLDLFEMESKIKENPDAKDFVFKDGDIEFRNLDLSFSQYQSVF